MRKQLQETTLQVVVLQEQLAALLCSLPLQEKVSTINALRETIHEHSPFAAEPVDFVRWVPNDAVHANDYNPNSVAPPEMELLRVSIEADGYTQPIVGMQGDQSSFEVVDGFHRHRVGKECDSVRDRVHGYLPVVQIRQSQVDRSNRMAATIRHNRARGKHKVEAMSDIVIELKRRNWSDERIGRELGMDPDEVLRLCQITGLAEAFGDGNFSEAWEVDKEVAVGSDLLSDVLDDYEPDDGDRVLHTWDKWECYRHGFYAEKPPRGLTQEQGEEEYRRFLADTKRFSAALEHVITEWKHSCEHYLTNDRMNRIAWLGQAAAAQATGMPSGCRGGFNKLTKPQQEEANQVALDALNKWLRIQGRKSVTMEQAGGRTEMELY